MRKMKYTANNEREKKIQYDDAKSSYNPVSLKF